MRPVWTLFTVILCGLSVPAWAQEKKEEKPAADSKEKEILAGHSYHGEAFNEGPRQAAYLMEGTGKVNFPVTSKKPQVQAFIEQGVGQLHGFWNFEAERSFRQAALLDPECAMAYWGMALANAGNEKRAKGFIAEAVKRKEQASEREKMYIDGLNAYIQAGKSKKKDRAQKYTKSLERLIYKYPADLDAKAFLALQMWKNRSSDIPISSYLAIDALLQQVFAVEPMHPCHHYRIHLWDYEKPETAVTSAAKCGQTSPGIAHMWHMPGHIFSRLKRYNDAAWQQEASARVDHAHMIRDRVLPDQIGNFAHNNEWLIRNLIYVGRVQEALDLAKNMTELPRHPKYNTLSKRGSAYYGRQRLFQVLSTYEMWDELIQLSDTRYLRPTENLAEQLKRERHLGAAYFRSGKVAQGNEQLAQLEKRLVELKQKQKQAEDAAEAKVRKEAKPAKKKEQPQQEKKQEEKQEAATAQGADAPKDTAADDKKAVAKPVAKPGAKQEDSKDLKKKISQARSAASRSHTSNIRNVEKAVQALQGHRAVSEEKFKEGLDLLRKAGGLHQMNLARIEAAAGETDKVIESVKKYVDSHRGEILPQATLASLQWEHGHQKDALETFKKLRKDSAPIDLEVAAFQRLDPIAEQLGFPADWRVPLSVAKDIGERPSLDSLGPFRWHPSPAPDWTLKDDKGQDHSLKQYRGKPVVVIFYLGFGCLHCAEQLKAFAPMTEEFKKAGVSLVAISTDDQKGLKQSIEGYDKAFPFPLVSDAKLDVFKAYRSYDDFEKQTLHGTFLIDEEGLVRWQDISYEPFMDPKFVLGEYKRLFGKEATTKAKLSNK
ncbi:MAG: redoxin domain-containing protein [Planctomycetaceae bacterium]|nr:redoxin domain-containing protein [Planctomycetaceae bacterium]